jgi:hypothetical protein
MCRWFKTCVSFTYCRCLESRVQCAAVSTWRGPTNEPPHQNSVRREPCKKMAAIQGHRPGRDSSPPTTRKAGTSGWPHSADTNQCPSLSLTSELYTTMSAANRICLVTSKMSHLLATYFQAHSVTILHHIDTYSANCNYSKQWWGMGGARFLPAWI